MLFKNNTKIFFILIISLLYIQSFTQNQYCNHRVFCNEKILKAISDSQLFQNDFKEFVDLVLKVPI